MLGCVVHYISSLQEVQLQRPPIQPLCSSSLELGDLERRRAGQVQEKGPFLFRQEGGGCDIVDACWDVVHLQVTEATSVEAKNRKHNLLLEAKGRIPAQLLFYHHQVLNYFWASVTTPVISTVLLVDGGRTWIPHSRHRHHLKANTVLSAEHRQQCWIIS